MEVDANGGASAAAETDAITNGSAKQPQATATGEGGSGAGEPVAAVVAGTGAGAKEAVSTAGQAGESSKTSEGQGAPEAGAPASSDPKQKQIKPGAGSLKVQVRDRRNSRGGCWAMTRMRLKMLSSRAVTPHVLR